MLLYIHTQTTTYIYRTSKTNRQAQLKNAYGLAPQPYPHLTRALQRDASKFPLRVSLHRLLTRERQNVKMLAKQQLVSYGCLFFFFFLLKKPLGVGVLSSPRRKSREHHQSPGFKGGAVTPLSTRPSGLRQRQADPKGLLSCGLLQEGWFPTVALAPRHGLLKTSVNLGRWRPIPKACVRDTLLA